MWWILVKVYCFIDSDYTIAVEQPKDIYIVANLNVMNFSKKSKALTIANGTTT